VARNPIEDESGPRIGGAFQWMQPANAPAGRAGAAAEVTNWLPQREWLRGRQACALGVLANVLWYPVQFKNYPVRANRFPVKGKTIPRGARE
jgi:hypothetical protein